MDIDSKQKEIDQRLDDLEDDVRSFLEVDVKEWKAILARFKEATDSKN